MSGLAPERVTTGAVVSITFTTREVVPVFPAPSTYTYPIVELPSAPVFTLPLLKLAITPLPSTASVHTAHSSTKAFPYSTSTTDAPLRVTTGGVVSGAAMT